MEYIELPDIKGLAALRAIVELGGVAQAADTLNVGQPAVTKRLRALEKSYGMALMQLKNRRLELTPAGERVYAFARLVLDYQSMLTDDLETLRVGQNRLRLEVTSAIGEHFLPELLLQFADAHPEYRIETRMGYTRRIQTRLATGMADMALLEQAPDHPDILLQQWREDELIMVCGQNHPLWQSPVIAIQRLLELNYVLREPDSSIRHALDKALQEVGIRQLPVQMEVGSTDTIVEMLQRGKHVSFLPRFTVSELISEGSLYHIPVEGLEIKRTLWIARSRANVDSPVAEAFIELLRSYRSR